MATDQEPHTVAIPGIQDIIRIPPLDDPKLKRERIQRWRAGNSALPESLNWLPAAINWLDDIEDQLIVSLVSLQIAAKYGPRLVGKIVGAAAPGIGWLLIADDILNVTNGLLELLSGGSFGKLSFIKTMRALFNGRASALTRGTDFLKGRVRWLGYGLQAGQVLYNWTGWGIQLGTVFGGISDATWAGIKALNNEPVTIIGPPPSDILMKYSRAWLGAAQLPFISGGMTTDELQTIGAGLWTAALGLGGAAMSMVDDGRLEDQAQTVMPVYKPWNPATLEALSDEGIPVDDTMVNALPFYERGATYGAAFRVAAAVGGRWDEEIAPKLRDQPGSELANALFSDVADMGWAAYIGPDGAEKPLTPYEKMQGIAVETNVWPPWHAGSPGKCTSSVFFPEPPPPLTTLDCSHLWFIQEHACPPPPPRDCIIFDDGTFICRPGPPPCYPTYTLTETFRLPAAYPPDPTWDQRQTLAHWLWLALNLYCGMPVPMPVFASTETEPTAIVGWTANNRRHQLAAPFNAALLVWGNAWRKAAKDAAEPTIWPPIKVCTKGTDGLPLLFGPDAARANPPFPQAQAGPLPPGVAPQFPRLPFRPRTPQ